MVAVAALPTLLPLFFAGIRWPSFEGEMSAAGNSLTRMHVSLVARCFSAAGAQHVFRFQIQPQLAPADAPIGFLTFYYMGSLCVGYYSGYILLVFGKGTAQGWERPGPLIRILNLANRGIALVVGSGRALPAFLPELFPHQRRQEQCPGGLFKGTHPGFASQTRRHTGR